MCRLGLGLAAAEAAAAENLVTGIAVVGGDLTVNVVVFDDEAVLATDSGLTLNVVETRGVDEEDGGDDD